MTVQARFLHMAKSIQDLWQRGRMVIVIFVVFGAGVIFKTISGTSDATLEQLLLAVDQSPPMHPAFNPKPEPFVYIPAELFKKEMCTPANMTKFPAAWFADKTSHNVCNLDDYVLAMDPSTPESKRLAQFLDPNWRKLQYPRDYNGNLCPEVSWKEPISFVVGVPNGRMTSHGLVYDDNFTYRNGKWYFDLKELKQNHERPTFQHHKALFSLVMWSSALYQHYIHDALPKVDFAFKFLQDHPEIKMILPKGAGERIMKKLFPAERILTRDDGIFHSADMLYFPSWYRGKDSQLAIVQSGLHSDMRDRLFGHPPIPLEEVNLVVYMKRPSVKVRSVGNDHELIKAVTENLKSQYKFMSFIPTDDWEKDKEIMERAVVIMGPHGGAMSNIFFTHRVKPANVIEFTPIKKHVMAKQNSRPSFYGISAWLRIPYWFVEPPDFDFNRAGMTVQVDQVLNILRLLDLLKPTPQ